MENLFSLMAQFINEGLAPMLTLYVDWLMHDGLFFGLGIIVLPLVARIINILKKLF